MAAPTRVNAATATSSGTTAATADISAAAVGSWMIAVITTDSNGVGPAPSGWTVLLPAGTQQATGTRRTSIAARIKQAGDNSVSWNSAASAYKRLTVFHGTGSAPISAWTFGTIGVRAAGDVVSGQSVQAGSSSTSVAPSVTAPSDALVLSVLVEVSTAVGEPTVSGAAIWLNSGDASPVIEQHTIAYATPAPGATAAVTATYVPTQASNGMGVQIVIPSPSGSGPVERTAVGTLTLSGSATAVVPRRPGFNSVAQMLATPGATWAHRGGSVNWPEMSEYAYDQAVLAGYGALEFSAHRTSDGVWVGSHDPSLNRTSQTSGLPNISAMTWAQVQTYMNTLTSAGTPRPYYRLDAFLDKYASTHVCIVDPKNDVGRIAEFLDICDAHGGNTKLVVKFFGVGSGSTALADAATARGYQTWGYFYEANIGTGDLAADQSHWSILGMEYGASQAAWDTVLSYGKPVVGHIAASQANYDTAIAKGARMVQCSNVAGISAVGATSFIGEGKLTLSGTAARAVGIARTATGTLEASGTAPSGLSIDRTAVATLGVTGSAERTLAVSRAAVGELTLTGSGTLESGGTTRDARGVLEVNGWAERTLSIERVAVGALSAGGTATATSAVDRDAVGELAVSGIADFAAAIARAAIGVLALFGVGRLPSAAIPTVRTLTEIPVSSRTLVAHDITHTLEDE